MRKNTFGFKLNSNQNNLFTSHTKPTPQKPQHKQGLKKPSPYHTPVCDRVGGGFFIFWHKHFFQKNLKIILNN